MERAGRLLRERLRDLGVRSFHDHYLCYYERTMGTLPEAVLGYIQQFPLSVSHATYTQVVTDIHVGWGPGSADWVTSVTTANPHAYMTDEYKAFVQPVAEGMDELTAERVDQMTAVVARVVLMLPEVTTQQHEAIRIAKDRVVECITILHRWYDQALLMQHMQERVECSVTGCSRSTLLRPRTRMERDGSPLPSWTCDGCCQKCYYCGFMGKFIETAEGESVCGACATVNATNLIRDVNERHNSHDDGINRSLTGLRIDAEIMVQANDPTTVRKTRDFFRFHLRDMNEARVHFTNLTGEPRYAVLMIREGERISIMRQVEEIISFLCPIKGPYRREDIKITEEQKVYWLAALVIDQYLWRYSQEYSLRTKSFDIRTKTWRTHFLRDIPRQFTKKVL